MAAVATAPVSRRNRRRVTAPCQPHRRVLRGERRAGHGYLPIGYPLSSRLRGCTKRHYNPPSPVATREQTVSERVLAERDRCRARDRGRSDRRRPRGGRTCLGRRRPQLRRLRRRHRVPEHRARLPAGGGGHPRAGGSLPPPVLHGRRLRALRRGLQAARGALTVRRRRAALDPRQLRRGGDRERGEDRPRGHGPSCGDRLRERVPRADAADDDDDGEARLQEGLRPFAPEVYRAPGPYAYRGVSSDAALEALEDLFRSDVDPESVACAVLEPVQGEAASSPMPDDFPRRLKELLSSHGILYVDDEVQSGVGRSGLVWAIEHYGVEPDIVVSGKSLGGGLPLAGVTGRAEVMDACIPAGWAARSAATRSRAPRHWPCSTRWRRRSSARGRTRSASGCARRSTPCREGAGRRRGARPRPDARPGARRRPRDEAPDGELAKRTMELARERGLILSLRHVRERPALLPPLIEADEIEEVQHPGGRACRRKRRSFLGTEAPAGEADVRLIAVRDVRGRRRRRLDRPRDPARRVLHDARAVRLRQDDDAG